MEKESRHKLLYQVDEKPPVGQGLLLSIQHVFAMFGATILVPLILGMPVSTALLASGTGTLLYILSTKAKVPVYLGSSFAYISAMAFAKEQMNGSFDAALTGIMLVGIVYVVVAFIISKVGTDWLHRLLPPIVIGPMVIVIGLGLAGTAVQNAGFVEDSQWQAILVAIITFGITVYVQSKGRGFIRVIPFLVAIIGGYIVAALLGLVDFSPISEARWIQLPNLMLPFDTPIESFTRYHFYFGPETFAMVPIALVTIAEHIGDHIVLGEITDRDFLTEPGLERTIFGDGIATLFSAFIGGPANTTYGENTGVIGLTKIASVSVIRNAALMAILLSFCGKFTALIATIPAPVLGGMSILLYGVIGSNGLKILVSNRIDFNESRNLIIASAMLVIGLGGAVVDLGGLVMITGTALSAIVGIVLNLLIPESSNLME